MKKITIVIKMQIVQICMVVIHVNAILDILEMVLNVIVRLFFFLEKSGKQEYEKWNLFFDLVYFIWAYKIFVMFLALSPPLGRI